jgi:hypothetical protein
MSASIAEKHELMLTTFPNPLTKSDVKTEVNIARWLSMFPGRPVGTVEDWG